MQATHIDRPNAELGIKAPRSTLSMAQALCQN